MYSIFKDPGPKSHEGDGFWDQRVLGPSGKSSGPQSGARPGEQTARLIVSDTETSTPNVAQ